MPPSAAETTHSSGDALSGRAIKHCQFCPNPTADNATSYGVSYAELRESGEKGCAACAFICAGIAGVLGSDEPIIFNLWIVAQLPEATSAHTALSHSAARHSGAHSSAGGRCFIYLSLPGENKCIEIYTDDGTLDCDILCLLKNVDAPQHEFPRGCGTSQLNHMCLHNPGHPLPPSRPESGLSLVWPTMKAALAAMK